MRRIRKGFTLIELLVVVLIIGILASIAIPQYFKVVEQARVSEAMSAIASIKSAQERFLARGGTYSSDFTKLDIMYPGMTANNLPIKFYNLSMIASSDASGPNYALTATRHETHATVAQRFGAYVLAVNVPNKPRVVVMTCPGGGENCEDLID